MKLVQLLAKELKEWPEGAGDVVGQARDGSLHLNGSYEENRGFTDEQYTLAKDWMSADVTKSQWQAEREKMNKPKWIRHRGGNSTLHPGTMVEARLRSGEIQRAIAGAFLWDNSLSDHAVNIMAYRVIEETKDQEIEEVKKTNFGAITYKLEIDATEATKEIDSLVAKWGQIESPLKWRDEIIELEAYEEEFRREREKLIRKLESEGFKLIDHVAPVYGFADVDFSDWRNWQIGDRVCATKNFDDVDIGDELIITRLDHADERQPIGMSAGSSSTSWPDMNWVKFVSRP